MFYVTASDSFFSGWGMAHEKVNKVVVECETYEDATKAYNKLKNRHEMKYVNIASKKPYYSSNKYYVSFYGLENNSVWV